MAEQGHIFNVKEKRSQSEEIERLTKEFGEHNIKQIPIGMSNSNLAKGKIVKRGGRLVSEDMEVSRANQRNWNLKK